MQNGYATSAAFARAGTEILAGVATGGAASALSKGGKAAQLASAGIRVAQGARGAGNAIGGANDIATNGLNVQNGLRTLGGTLSVVGSVSALKLGGAPNCLAENGGCFFAGTPVATEFGLRAVEDVKAEERVWAFDLVAREWRLCRVAETYKTDYVGEKVGVLIDLKWERIESTAHHPVWVVEGENLADRPRPEHVRQAEVAGATAPGRWVDACDLLSGDVLLLKPDRRATVRAVRFEPVAATVYNFQVEGLHNYAVGFAGVLVHNASPCSTIAQNAADGGAFEDRGSDLAERVLSNTHEQVSVRPYLDSGEPADYLVRPDTLGTNELGDPEMYDYKASETAGLTRNQTDGYPLIERNGGVVAGLNGMPEFPPGYEIPPTEVHIIRPEDLPDGY